MNKKVCTFTGAIMGIVASSITTLVYLIVFIMMAAILNMAESLASSRYPAEYVAFAKGLGSTIIWILILILLLSIATMVLNILSLKASRKSDDEYLSSMGSIITAIVLQTILAGISIWLLGLILGILILLVLIAVDVLYIVDLAMINKKNPLTQKPQKVIKFYPASTNPSNGMSNTSQGEKSMIDKMKELETLAELKNKNIISEQEFENLKKDILK